MSGVDRPDSVPPRYGVSGVYTVVRVEGDAVTVEATNGWQTDSRDSLRFTRAEWGAFEAPKYPTLG